MFWPGLRCKTVTDLRLERWVPELSPGNVGETSIFSFEAAVMSLFCPELAALEEKSCFYGQIFPIKKSLVCHLALVCLWSSVLWCLFSASLYSDDFKIYIKQKLYPFLWKFCIFSPYTCGCDLAPLSNLWNMNSLSSLLIILPGETGCHYLIISPPHTSFG